MDTRELLTIAKRDSLVFGKLMGVYPRDELPVKIKYGHFAIVNCCKSTLPGKHWILLYQRTQNQLEFCDSFGQTPGYWGFSKFQLPEYRSLTVNGMRMQSENSTVCGLYCLYFCHKLSRVGGPIGDIIGKNFTRDFPSNDRFIVKQTQLQFTGDRW